MKKILSLLILWLMLCVSAGCAENIQAIQPLLDEQVRLHLNQPDGSAGAVPMLVEENGDMLTVICELYTSELPQYDPTVDDVFSATWIGTGEFVLQKSASSPQGYELLSFTPTVDELNDNPLATYTNDTMGFSFAYPTELTEYLTETDTGVQAVFPNKELSLIAMATPNPSFTLEAYGALLAAQYPDSLLAVYPDLGYFSLAYTYEYWTCYRVVYVTESTLYEAELRFVSAQEDIFGLFAEYLENSFTIFEFAVG